MRNINKINECAGTPIYITTILFVFETSNNGTF